MSEPSVPNEATPADAAASTPASAPAAEAPTPEAEIAALRAALAAKEEEAKANYDRYLRERAELENFKRRTRREMAEAARFAIEPLVRDLLPVVDNLERALAQEPGNEAALREGVRLVHAALVEALARHGVTGIDAVGQPFDPSRHEAMARVETDAHEPNTVIEQHHRGYQLHERLLRPALVTVSAPAAGEGDT